jgi:hypothetical protein
LGRDDPYIKEASYKDLVEKGKAGVSVPKVEDG